MQNQEKVTLAYSTRLEQMFKENKTQLKKLDELIETELDANPGEDVQVIPTGQRLGESRSDIIDGALNSFMVNGTIFVIMTSFEKVPTKNKVLKGAAIIEIFKYQEAKFHSVYEKKLNDIQDQETAVYNSNPYIVHNNMVKFMVVSNDIKSSTITHTLVTYDLENNEEKELKV